MQRGRLACAMFRFARPTIAIGAAILLPFLAPSPAPARTSACTSTFAAVKTPAIPGLLANSFAAVSADSPADAWAVGRDGRSAPLVERFDGSSWTVVATPRINNDETDLRTVAAIGSSDVWAGGTAAGDPVLMHWNGSAWTTANVGGHGHGSLNGLSALTSNDMWAVGEFSTNFDPTVVPRILRYNGSSWTVVPGDGSISQGSLTAVSAWSATDAWAVGSDSVGALLEHWNGSTWAAAPDPGPSITDALTAVVEVSPSDVWAVGSTGTDTTRTLVEHYDGMKWSVVHARDPNPYADALSGVVATSASDVWAVGQTGAGARVRPLIEHWNGSSWKVVATSLPSPGALAGVTLTGAGMTAVGRFSQPVSGIDRTLAAEGNGSGWSEQPSPNVDDPHAKSFLLGIAATSPSDAWAVGETLSQGNPSVEPVAEHWDGHNWSAVATPGIAWRSFSAVASTGVGNAWAVGQDADFSTDRFPPLAERFDGTRWRTVRLPAVPDRSELVAVSADAANDTWAVGGLNNGRVPSFVLHWDGSVWRRETVPILSSNTALNGVFAQSPTDVWIVGERSRSGGGAFVGHWDGATWTTSHVPHPGLASGLVGVTGGGAGGVWAVGSYEAPSTLNQPMALHESGGVWTNQSPPPLPDGADLQAVGAVNASDVWAAGSQGAGGSSGLMEHWDGRAWSTVSLPPSTAGLLAVATLPSGHVWATQSASKYSVLEACGV
jgi:hypothetical protein